MAAYAALTSLSQTADLTINKHIYLFFVDVEEKIRSIHEHVTVLLSFLQDFPEKAKRWEGKMRDVANEAEDILDEYVSEQQSNNGKRKLPSSKFEGQLEKVMVKMWLMAGDVMDERPAYLPHLASSSSSRVAPAGNDPAIGLDDDVMAIKDRLCGLSSKLQVIPIVGMGGIGKTTLARTVYDDLLISGHFDIRVWLTISQDYNSRELLFDLMKLMGDRVCLGHSDSLEEMDYITMVEKVYKNLKGRRYLIVMDDVWSTKVWDDVRNIFPDDCNGSRIMFTTRLVDLAAYPNCVGPRHEMKFMDASQSWDLLRGRVFANDCSPPELEYIGKDIARSCRGLPLAVVLVAGFLSTIDNTPSSWKKIAKNVNRVISQESEGILSLSYTQLPHHLRPCFLFLGVYPEDENVQASRLIKLWVAEGFIKHQNGCSKSLEEEAEEYLEDLVKRNLVIVNHRKSDGKIKRCSLHDIVRDLCIRKAREEKFFHVMDGRVDVPQGNMDDRSISLIKFSNIDSICSPTIRTILRFQIRGISISPAFLKCVRLLRVFDATIGNCIEPSYNGEVYRLFHLRHLALVCTFNISSAISHLTNLQTLIVFPVHREKRYWRFHEDVPHLSLPLQIWRMPQLRHLVFHHLCMLPHPPCGLNLPLANLQTLFYIKNLAWNETILQMIPNIKRLGLVYGVNEEFELHLLKHLHQLEKLEIFGFDRFSWQRQQLAFPTTLKKLSLVRGGFPWKDMSMIGSLPNLQVLKLRNRACSGETWETADGEFPELRFLVIEESHLQHWLSERSHFPRLKCLVLRSCRVLREIPIGIGEIPTLELIQVEYGNESLVKSAKQIKEDQESYGNYSLQVRTSHSLEPNRRSRREKFYVELGPDWCAQFALPEEVLPVVSQPNSL